MENRLILKKVVNDYIEQQSDDDQFILSLFCFEEIHNIYKLSNVTGFSRSRIDHVIRRLRVYLGKCGYSGNSR